MSERKKIILVFRKTKGNDFELYEVFLLEHHSMHCYNFIYR